MRVPHARGNVPHLFRNAATIRTERLTLNGNGKCLANVLQAPAAEILNLKPLV